MKKIKKIKKMNAIIKNDVGEICYEIKDIHQIEDILQIALARNEISPKIKNYIINNYKEFVMEFEIE
mgnify:CR=1 FL=1